jgi:hypothetical protein
MAAVAALLRKIFGVMTAAADLSRAYVNDGGDIALSLPETICVSAWSICRTGRRCLIATWKYDPGFKPFVRA